MHAEEPLGVGPHRGRPEPRLHGQRFDFEEGETLHTENSYKFTVEGLHALAVKAGLKPAAVWTDPERLFSVHWLQSPAAQ